MQHLHALAHGKLARMSDAAVSEQLSPDGLPRLTARTITDIRTRLRELAVVRATRLAHDREEHGDGVCAVATDIAYAGRHYEIVVLVPAYRFEGSHTMIEAALLACAQTIQTTAPPGAL